MARRRASALPEELSPRIRTAGEGVLDEPAFGAAAGRLAAAFAEERPDALAPKALEAVGQAGSIRATVQPPAAASNEV